MAGVFANHDEYLPAWPSHNFLEPIDEERLPSSRREDDFAAPGPCPKRLRTGFVCERCDETFTEKRSLARHRRYAANCERGEQPLRSFVCSVAACPKIFSRDDVRKRHEKEKHFNIKRRQRGFNLLPSLRLGSTNRSRPTDATSTSPYSHLQAGEAIAEPSNSVHGLSHEYRISEFGTSPPTSVYSIAESRNELNTSPSSSSNAFRRRWSSSTGSDRSVCDSLKYSTTNTSCTTYGSDADQLSVVAETCGSTARASQDEDWLSARRVSFDLHPRRDLVKGGASARPASQRKVRVCPLCSRSFGSTRKEVHAHLDRHCFNGEGQHKCRICQIGFVHEADLNHHLASARRGSCGLKFEHIQKCTGHHPPTPDQRSLSDRDRMKLSTCLQNWELSQLQDLIALISDVMEDLSSEADDCWSVDGALRRSMQSVSILFSGLDIRSTPEYMEHHLRTAMHRVRRSVANRVPISSDASFKIKLGKKAATHIRLGRALVEASAMGNLREMKELILRGAPVNDDYVLDNDMASCTPLMAAVCGGNKVAVEFLLENEAVVDGLPSQSTATVATPLCLAAGRGDIDIVQCLLDYNANVNKEAQIVGGHPACYAARNGHTNILSLLIDRGANIHLQAAVELDVHESADSFEPLSSGNILAIAAHHDRLDVVKMLLDHPEIEFDYCDTSAALAMAAYQGNLAMVELLLAKHPQLCTFFALWIADSQGHKVVVDTLIDHQIQLEPELPLQSRGILKRAIRQSQKDMPSRMLSPHDGPQESCDQDIFACRHYESKAAYALTGQAHFMAADMGDQNFAMALNCAVYYHDLGAARVLLEAGLSPNADIYPSNRRYLATNLSLASRIGHVDMVKLLLHYGADPSRDGSLSLDLLEAALDAVNVGTLRTLLGAGETLIPKLDQWSCSSFNAAVQKVVRAGSISLLQVLIEGGLDVNQVHIDDESGGKTTLLQIAAGRVTDENSYETMELLLENGAYQ